MKGKITEPLFETFGMNEKVFEEKRLMIHKNCT